MQNKSPSQSWLTNRYQRGKKVHAGGVILYGISAILPIAVALFIAAAWFFPLSFLQNWSVYSMIHRSQLGLELTVLAAVVASFIPVFVGLYDPIYRGITAIDRSDSPTFTPFLWLLGLPVVLASIPAVVVGLAWAGPTGLLHKSVILNALHHTPLGLGLTIGLSIAAICLPMTLFILQALSAGRFVGKITQFPPLPDCIRPCIEGKVQANVACQQDTSADELPSEWAEHKNGAWTTLTF